MTAISVTWLSISWGAVLFETHYGLMQHSHLEIKNKLLKALDAEYNVVDMATVFEVIAVLETIPISADILQATRLGRLVNGLRRRTKNEALAKRAKDLVRRWRHMIGSDDVSVCTPSVSVSVAPHQNGSTHANHYSEQPPTPTNRHHRLHYNQAPCPTLSCDPKVEPVPRTHAANKRLRKDDDASNEHNIPVKRCKVNGVRSPRTVVDSNTNNSNSCSRSGNVSKGAAVDTSLAAPNIFINHTLPSVSSSKNSYNSVEHANSVPAPISTEVPFEEESVQSEVVPSPKKRGRKKGSKKDHHHTDELKEKLAAMSKAVKIKTTQELVNELKSRSDERFINNASLLASSSCSIPGEDGRSEELVMRRNKSDQLQHSDQPPVNRSASVIEDEINELYSRLPPIDPSVLLEDIKESAAFSEEPKKEVTDEQVARLHCEQIEGVNGVYDQSNHEFKRWNEMTTVQTLNGDLLPVLPYTIID